MKVIWQEDQTPKRTLSMVAPGDTFRLPAGSQVYIRVAALGGPYRSFVDEGTIRVVSLESGNMFEYPVNKEVVLVHVTVHAREGR